MSWRDRRRVLPPSAQLGAGTVISAAFTEQEAWTLASAVSCDGLWYFDVANDRLRLSARALALLGYGSRLPAAERADVAEHVESADLPALQRALSRIIRDDGVVAEVEVRRRTLAGESRWTLLRASARRDGSGRVVLIAGSLVDIHGRKTEELRAQEVARRDPLTGLANRDSLTEQLTARVTRARTAPLPRFAVLYFDIDRFKQVNDTFGHAAGDVVLLETASRMRALLRPADLLARVGGDEFVIMLDAVTDADEAQRFGELLQQTSRTMIDIDGRELSVSVSVGIRVSADWSIAPAEFLRDADVAMYHAKRLGGARTVVFDRPMYAEMVNRIRLHSELHDALERNELHLAYQPIFELTNQRLVGFEALARWRHPTRGQLSAMEFMEEADQSGLIVQLGRWVLGSACRQLAEWRLRYPDAGNVSIAVNLSARELAEPGFASSVEAALLANGLPAHSLVLELTERVMSENADRTILILRRLRDLGVQIQLDNFGRGFSSLSMLRTMPLTAIKIDRSFIAEVDSGVEARAIVETITAFARALGLEVVAEGVETSAQADVLRSSGQFRYVQGHHYGRPSGEVEAARMLG